MITIPLQSESLGVTLINNMAEHTFMMLNPMLRFDRLLSLRVSFCNRLTITEWCLLLVISKEYWSERNNHIEPYWDNNLVKEWLQNIARKNLGNFSGSVLVLYKLHQIWIEILMKYWNIKKLRKFNYLALKTKKRSRIELLTSRLSSRVLNNWAITTVLEWSGFKPIIFFFRFPP